MKKKLMMLILAACTVLYGCGAAKTEKAAEEDPAVMCVDGEKVGLREWNFYIRMNQMQWEKSYLDSYGDDMWSREVDDDGTTLAASLQQETIDMLCRIHLLNQHAADYGVSLDEEMQQEIRERAQSFMGAYNEKLLEYAGADEEFVYDCLCRTELSGLVAEASVADYTPDFPEEAYHREGICYVLISTTGLRDEEGNLTPFSEEEVERRTELAYRLCDEARENGDLKSSAETEGLTPIESSMGNDNEGDGKEPRMLDAARALAVGEISDPVQVEEGFFLVQHLNDYDEEGTEYWKQYLIDQAREERAEELYEEWKSAAELEIFQDTMDQVNVKIVLKELL